MTLKELIESRKHKYDDESKCSCSEEWKSYMSGWFHAYQDLEEILKQNNFNINQVINNHNTGK